MYEGWYSRDGKDGMVDGRVGGSMEFGREANWLVCHGMKCAGVGVCNSELSVVGEGCRDVG